MSTPIIDSSAGALLKMGPPSTQGTVPPVQGAAADDQPDFAQMLAAMDRPTPAPASPQEEGKHTQTATLDTPEAETEDADPLQRDPSNPRTAHAIQGDEPTRPLLTPDVTAPPPTQSKAATQRGETVPQSHEGRTTHVQNPVRAGDTQSPSNAPAAMQSNLILQRMPETPRPAQMAHVNDSSPSTSIAPTPPDALPEVAAIATQTRARPAIRDDKHMAMTPDGTTRVTPAMQAPTNALPLQPSDERGPRIAPTPPPLPPQAAIQNAQPATSLQPIDTTRQAAVTRAIPAQMPLAENTGSVPPSAVETLPYALRTAAVVAPSPDTPQTGPAPSLSDSLASQFPAGQSPAAQQTVARPVPVDPLINDAPASMRLAPPQKATSLANAQTLPERSVNILVKASETPAQSDRSGGKRPAVAAPQYAAVPVPETGSQTLRAKSSTMPSMLPNADATALSTPPPAPRSQMTPPAPKDAKPVSNTQTAITAVIGTAAPGNAATPPMATQGASLGPPAASEVQVRIAPYSIQPDATRSLPLATALTQAPDTKPAVVSVTLGTAEVRVPTPLAANTSPTPMLHPPAPALPFAADQQAPTGSPITTSPPASEAKVVPIAGAPVTSEASQRKTAKADMLRSDTQQQPLGSGTPTHTAILTAPRPTAFAASAPMNANIPMDHTTKPDAAFSLLAPADGGDVLNWDPSRTTQTATGPAHPLRADMTPHIARQMVEVMPQAAHRPVEIALSPQELGRVRMSITTEDGVVTVNILAERADTLDLMRRNIEQLGQSFRSMGYDQITFSFGQGMGGNEQGADGQGEDAAAASRSITDSDTIENPTPDAASPALRVRTTGIDIRL